MRVPLRETFAGTAKGHGRHVKQSGGHGQYAVCDIEVEPLPEGGGFEFVDKVVGGSVPRQFIPSVEKGVRAQMEKGVGPGYPVVDIRVTLLRRQGPQRRLVRLRVPDGRRPGAARGRRGGGCICSSRSTRCGADPRRPVGAVMGDLSSRRAGCSAPSRSATGRTLVQAEVPQVELTSYAIDLRSLSHGAGSFTRTFARYEPMPESAAAKVKAEA